MSMRFLRSWVHKAVLGGALLGGAGAVTLIAQTVSPFEIAQPAATPSVQRNYLNKLVIQLPIVIEDAQRQRIQEIHLYVKDHPTAAWTQRDKVGPGQTSFTFTAPRDGEYLFTMVTIDKQGRSHPADLRNEPPGLAVVIDTQAPVVELTNLGETPIGTLIQCDIRDAHLDNGKTRLQFQGGDGVFRPMAAVPGKANVFCIPYEAVCSGLVRATAEDLANNQAFREEHLNNMRNSQKAAANSDRKGTIPTNPIQTVGASGGPIMMDKMTPQRMPKGNGFEIVQRSPQDGPTLPIGAGAKSTPRPDGTDGPRWLVQTKHETTEAGQTEVGVIPPLTNVNAHVAKAAHTAAAATAVKRQITAKNKVFLEYQIENAGLSGVGKVEAWITRDKGQSWHKVGEESNSKNPLEMHLPGEGLFGVTLVASNGRGVVGRPPATGDTPDGWIEVDTTKPFAQITNVKSATEDGKSVVHIHWTVTDKNLGDAPVDLFYGPTPQGIWLPIAKGLKADGQHRWTPPVEIGPQAHLRLIATDLAGNIGIASTLEPVLFDDPARPRAVIRNILTSMPPSSIVPARSADPTPPHIVQPPPMPQ